MKKALMMALAATCLSMPAMANDAMSRDAKAQAKTDKYFTEADTNKDNTISKSEHEAAANRMFSDADTNGDGSLSKEEVKAAKEKEWEKMKNAKPQ